MESQYQPKTIEAAARSEWEAAGAHRATEQPGKPKYYCLSMLPYPSGKLHMGHVRNYTIGDALTRYLKMKGYNVLQPMGWDAFGLPAENAAIKEGVPPAKWTYDNIAYMKQQCQAMGWALDWDREFASCDPDYYRWNQWLFLRMWEQGIVYRKSATVNWDPVDMTVLANEQVIDGKGWRTGATVEKRDIPMYYMKITDYADELLGDLEKLGWPEPVKLMQKNWIGKSVGAEIHFPYDAESIGSEGLLKVFSTRPDTLYGATFIAVAAEHALATQAAGRDPRVAAFVEECRKGGTTEAELATQEKKGIDTGLFAVHPLTQARLPVWVGNYVLMGYGEGAVMGVPGHDDRDFTFAKKYGLPIVQVVALEGKAWSSDAYHDWYADDGKAIHSGDFTGLTTAQFKRKIGAVLAALDLGGPRITYRLRDWGISRQRYWGTPIPMIHCGACGEVPVPDDQLPVVLPEDCVPDGTGNPLNKRMDFVNCTCPKCGGAARRETDTMDTFVDSSWYFMRYTCPDAKVGGKPAMVDARADYWLPVDQYIGGIEHAILHLLYARFWTKVMRDMGLVKVDEPFANLLTQGMVLNHIFFRKGESSGIRYFAPDELDIEFDEHKVPQRAAAKDGSGAVHYDGLGTMSKSKRNGVDPQSMIEQYGADTARFYVMSANAPTDTVAWSDESLEGSFRFMKRLWKFVCDHVEQGLVPAYSAGDARPLGPQLKALRLELHKAIDKVGDDYGRRLQFNTAIAAVREMLNSFAKLEASDPVSRAVAQEVLEHATLLLAPIVPHICNAMWAELRPGTRLIDQAWPQADPKALVQDEIDLVIQVNGKLRGNIRVPAKATREEVEDMARVDDVVLKHTNGAAIKKVVVVPGRLVNVVV